MNAQVQHASRTKCRDGIPQRVFGLLQVFEYRPRYDCVELFFEWGRAANIALNMFWAGQWLRFQGLFPESPISSIDA